MQHVDKALCRACSALMHSLVAECRKQVPIMLLLLMRGGGDMSIFEYLRENTQNLF